MLNWIQNQYHEFVKIVGEIPEEYFDEPESFNSWDYDSKLSYWENNL